jgi:dTDP-4-dehydrorhamnose 3,5-epimerase
LDLSVPARQAFFVQDYSSPRAIEGVVLLELRRFNDDGGSFTELGRLTAGSPTALPGFEIKQVNYSEMDAGVIKAFHLHRHQTDVWFVPPSDKMLLVLVDVRADSATLGVCRRLVLGDGASRLVRIPPGVAHGVKNLAAGRGRIIYFVDRHFAAAPDQTDEGRLPWDFAGADVWEIQRG